ncbi:MAG: hypothetical protein ACI9NC_001513 [Verrucomicrobiales bacterium]
MPKNQFTVHNPRHHMIAVSFRSIAKKGRT